ncbi:hypothetical protein DSCA_42710 [Desulfosarcina alkanivorans]|uniref:Uncharacterized protein n=1 Tax=Desulfosarcina alkanivorans TaxID=571177 RepID=A0A5K7YTI0_9BACT|nr:hypothetical protein [Desulfosarcina alkanivorans]BBO70341.1 hypothetical protein DSCA_42710 [Desulfosarcina alkanivorans]
MNWKFWKKEARDTAVAVKRPKLPRPRDLPEEVGRKMVVAMKLDPDLVWSLKYVSRPMELHRSASEFRIYDPATAHHKGLVVKNWISLDDFPDMVLYTGNYDKSTSTVDIH